MKTLPAIADEFLKKLELLGKAFELSANYNDSTGWNYYRCITGRVNGKYFSICFRNHVIDNVDTIEIVSFVTECLPTIKQMILEIEPKANLICS